MAKKKAAPKKALTKKATTKKNLVNKAGRRKKLAAKKTVTKAAKKSTTHTKAGHSSVETPKLQVSFPPEVVIPGVGTRAGDAALPEIAFYYPNPYWHDAEWARNLILFFDGIGMLIPNYMDHAANFDDYAVIAGLKEHNLFHVFLPETFIDHEAVGRLKSAMLAIIESGALDSLPKEEGSAFAEISMSRMGFHVAEEAAQAIFEELKKRNLAKDTEDGVSIPLHPSVRHVILVLLAQILRQNGRTAGFELLPATDRPLLVQALTELLSQKQLPSAEHVIALDLQAVGVDLGSVPIGEILSFRAENRDLYRQYSRQLKMTVHELGLMDADAQQIALEERQEEIASLASDIRKTARKAWKKPATFCLSAAGAIWRAWAGDLVGASIAGGTALLSLGKPDSVDAGAYSYLFSARHRFI
jgi:Family of unknown function (DUF6236)